MNQRHAEILLFRGLAKQSRDWRRAARQHRISIILMVNKLGLPYMRKEIK